MFLSHPDIKKKIAGWQNELQELTGNKALLMVAYYPPTGKMKPKELMNIVCEETGVPLSKVKKKSRKKEVVSTRQLIAYYSRMLTGLPLKDIGKIIGGKDHTTVIHSTKRVKELLDTNDLYMCDAVCKINKRLEERNNTHPV